MDTWDFIKDQADGHAVGVITAKTLRSNYQYKLNGKEWQDELGLNIYVMDMRQYDPAIARWIVQDPVIHHNFSPYNAFDNNPVFWADPSGADSEAPPLDMFGRPTRDSSGQYIPAFERGTGNESFTNIGGLSEERAASNDGPSSSEKGSNAKGNVNQEPDENTRLAKKIATEYGYDWKEVKEFLDNNPFTPTSKGIMMNGVEVLSTKFIEDKKTIINHITDEAESQLVDKAIEFVSPKLAKTKDLGGQLLSTQEAHAPEKNYKEMQMQRAEVCKQTLIRYFFMKPTTHQKASMHNKFQNFVLHASRFDIIRGRNY